MNPVRGKSSAATLMFDALQTAMGKPGSTLRVVYIGTLAPARAGWWHDLVEGGSHDSTYVQALRGDPAKWDHWREVRRVNPLTAISPRFAAKLREELRDAQRDTRLKARWLSYRLNVPSPDESTVLLTVGDWERVEGRPVPERDGRPIIGLDLGGGRSWSAAVAIWRNGRTEAIACAPGVPDVAAQETRDRVPRGTYTRLVGHRSTSGCGWPACAAHRGHGGVSAGVGPGSDRVRSVPAAGIARWHGPLGVSGYCAGDTLVGGQPKTSAGCGGWRSTGRCRASPARGRW